MTYTKEQLIAEIGLQNMPSDVQDKMVETIYQTLNMRVGMALSDKLTDEQLDHLTELSKKGDDEVSQWIEQTVPEYSTVIESEMQTIIDEIKKSTQNMTKNI